MRYSFSDAITKPQRIQKGDYLSWGVPETDEWFQTIWFDTPKATLAAQCASEIRAQIQQLKRTSTAQPQGRESPAAFVHRRMLNSPKKNLLRRARIFGGRAEELPGGRR